MAKDETYRKLIHTERWLRLRRDVLTAHPLCQRCEEEDRLTPACEVHHIIPAETALNRVEMERLMFDPHNLRALCHDCHVRTHTEMGRGWQGSNEAAQRTEGERGVQEIFWRRGGGYFLRGGGCAETSPQNSCVDF